MERNVQRLYTTGSVKKDKKNREWTKKKYKTALKNLSKNTLSILHNTPTQKRIKNPIKYLR